MWKYSSILLTIAAVLSATANSLKCPCKHEAECHRLRKSDYSVYKFNQTIGYILATSETIWSKFYWDRLSMVSLVDFYDDQLMCIAHRNKVQIMAFANFTLEDVSSMENMKKWIEYRVQEAHERFYDGINLFIDDPVDSGESATRNNITIFVKTVQKRFHQEFPGSIVLFNVPFSPYNENKTAVDGKNYDYLELSKSVDLTVIMDFDQRSQSFDEPQCVAGAPESWYITIGSLMAYEQLGLDLSRMILALGFYVDEYLCAEYHQSFRCIIEPYNYRGSRCSSRVAKRIPWNVFKKMSGHCWVKVWDEHSNHDIYTYLDGSIYGMVKQYWSDYPALWKRLGLIEEKQLSGLGVWMLNYLDENIWKQMPVRTK